MNQGSPTRILAIDLARGLALVLMILSHGIKGLLSFEQFPYWGLVPVHLITKFSSTIFFMTFGMSLAVSFAPATADPPSWHRKRRKLIFRGLNILFWYKVLTVIEMSHLHDPSEVLAALLYLEFPSYAEILGFYALALLWIPYVLPLWQRSPLWVKALWPGSFWLAAILISRLVNLEAFPSLKAILIEEDGFYTWGQLSRAPFVFMGLFIGSFLINANQHPKRRLILFGSLAGLALLLYASFVLLYEQNLYSTFYALAENKGKHPPDLAFILFSLSGALGVVAFTILVGDRGARWLAPITLIGKEALTAFVFHLAFLFLVYRFLFDLWLKVSYTQALGLTAILMIMTLAFVQFKIGRNKNEVSQAPTGRLTRPRILSSRQLRTS